MRKPYEVCILHVMKIVVFLNTNVPVWNPSANHYQKLKSDFPSIQFSFPNNATELLSEITDADVLFSWLITPEMLDRATNLKWFHTAGIQYGHLFPPEVFDKIQVTNSKGAHSLPVSENLMGMILTLTRGIRVSSASDIPQEGDKQPPVKVLNGMTLGIFGMGANGSALARLAKAFGMHVVAIKRTVTGRADYADELWPPEYLGELIRRSDILALTAPLTKETEQRFGEEEFSEMREGTVLVSSSRPQLIKEDALIDAVEDGIVSGLGIDNMWPKESPLLQMSHVLVAHHVAPGEQGFWDRIFAIYSDNLTRFLGTKQLKNIMDRVLLY